jgi:hypothetical protein
MHKRLTVIALVLMMLFVSVPALRVVSSQSVAEKEGYVIMETARATYLVNQALIDRYGHETFSKLLNLVNERFDRVMNITYWSSEKFYGHKLEVSIDPLDREGIVGSGGEGHTNLQLGTDFMYTNETLSTVSGFPSRAIRFFLHEMTHGITPPSVLNQRWLCEGYACFLSMEVQVSVGDVTRNEADDTYGRSWEEYVKNGYLDFNFDGNRTIQDGWGYFITAWMLNNITETYGWATHERFFASLPDEYLYWMPSFSLSPAEARSYKYDLDSLIVGYYSLAAGTSLFSSFKSWGVNVLPNPITTVSLNGTHGHNHAYASEVTVSLSAAGENGIDKIEYSFDQQTWNIYAKPFLISENGILYCRSTDNAGNTGPTASVNISVESNSSTPPQPKPERFPATWAIAAVVVVIVVGFIITFHFKKRKH